MAFSSTLPIFFSFLFVFFSFSNAGNPPKPTAFTFPIKKEDSNTDTDTSNQYYTTIQFGARSTTMNMVIDLGGNFLWFNSMEYFRTSSSFRPILCDTQRCRIADGVGCTFCYDSQPVPGCTNNTCSDYALNPFTGTQGYSGLGTDVLRVYSTPIGDQYRVNDFPFQFSDVALRVGLACSTAGVIGLGRTGISLQAQLASTFKIPQKFSLCLPTSGNHGNLIVGEAAKYSNPFPEIVSLFRTTPLIRNPVATSGNENIGNFSIHYFINVTSIKVGDRVLVFNNTPLSIDENTGEGGTSIRSVKGYTSLHKSIHTVFVKEFVKAAASKNITRVASVAPFSACFDSKTIRSSKTGPDVPTVDLVLQNKKVYWRFYGSNSMVRVSEDVMCLAFVEGQPNMSGPSTSIVVGGYQMENYLLEFDVASSRLGFSPSLLLHDTSCSQFRAV